RRMFARRVGALWALLGALATSAPAGLWAQGGKAPAVTVPEKGQPAEKAERPDKADKGVERLGERTTAKAHAAFLAGQAAFNDGHYEVALQKFEESYKLSSRPELLLTLAQ